MGTAGIFARNVEAFHLSACIHVDDNTAHEVMRRRHNLDLACR